LEYDPYEEWSGEEDWAGGEGEEDDDDDDDDQDAH
jgi:hypothetical protein